MKSDMLQAEGPGNDLRAVKWGSQLPHISVPFPHISVTYPELILTITKPQQNTENKKKVLTETCSRLQMGPAMRKAERI